VKIQLSKWVKWSLSGHLDLSLRCGRPPGISQQNNKLIAVDEQTSGCDKGNAILAGSSEKKDCRFIGPGFGQCGPEMRGEELGIVIEKGEFRLRVFSQDPVVEKADLRLDPHGSQDFSKISGGQFRNVPRGRARDFLLKQGTI
jgi:hypothetical protein